jgi:glycosyltransferase involved in cell wall biosynthesis
MSLEETNGATILVLTTGHTAIDDRIYYKEILSTLADFPDLTIAAPSENGRPDELDGRVGFLDLGPHREGLRRLGLLPRAVAAVVRTKPEICHFHDFELLLAVPFLRALTRAKLVFDCHEVYPETVLTSTRFPGWARPLVSRFVGVFQRAMAAGLHAVIGSDPEVAKLFEGAVGDVRVVSNFPRLSYFEPGLREPEAVGAMRERLRGRRVLLYQGGMGEDRGLYVMLEAMRVLKERAPDVTLVLLGSFDARDDERVSRLVREHGLGDTVLRPGEVPHLDVPAWIRLAQVGLVPFQPTPKWMKNTPIKLFEYMACRVPVLAADLPPMRSFVERSGGGRVYDSTSPERLADGALALLADAGAMRRMAEGGRLWVEQEWNWDQMAQRVPSLYRDLRAR